MPGGNSECTAQPVARDVDRDLVVGIDPPAGPPGPHGQGHEGDALVTEGRMGDVVETMTLLALLPLMVLAAGFVSAVAG